MPRREGLAALLVALSLPLGALGGRTAAATEAERALARSSLSDGQSFEYARELTAMGPRLTGSASYQRAAEWCAGQFRALGITRVALEPFTIERGWERVSARARIIAPSDRPLHVASLGWMPSTPDGGLDAEVVALDSFSLDAIAARRSLQGRIALLPEGDPPGGPDSVARSGRALGIALRAAGALAMLVPDSDPDNQLVARGLGSPPPSACCRRRRSAATTSSRFAVCWPAVLSGCRSSSSTASRRARRASTTSSPRSPAAIAPTNG